MSEENKLISDEPENVQSNSAANDKLRWYVIHTYSGYENKVKANIEKIVENRNMYDVISEVVIPVEDVVEQSKNGQKKVVQRKIFPTYVFVKMVMNDDTWYVVRNTRGVTSFVGPGSKPVALSDTEVESMGIETFRITCDVNVGDNILITDGPFENSNGIVKEVYPNKHTVVVAVSLFWTRNACRA